MSRRSLLVAIFIATSLTSGVSGPSANTNKSVKFTATYQPLGQVLKLIQEQSGIRLVYANSKVDSFRVFRKFDDPPEEAVRKSLIGTPFDFIKKSSTLWVIVPRSQTRNMPAHVTGQVIDINLGVPVGGANIYIERSNLGTSTDSLGNFGLYPIPPGRQKLLITRIGYHEKEMALTLVGNRNKHVTIRLQPKQITTPEVVIEEVTLASNQARLLSEQEVTSNQLDSAPIANDGDIFEFLHLQPGISRRDIHDVFPHIEGGSAAEVLVELDGMPIYVPTFGENRRSVFASPTIQNLSLHRSGFGVEYGDAMSGVVALKTKGFTDISYATKATASLTGFSINYRKNSPTLGVNGMWRTGRFNNDLNFHNWEGLDVFNKLELRPARNKHLTINALVSHGKFIQSNSQKTEQLVSQSIGLKYEIDPGEETNKSLLLYRTSLNNLQREFGFKLRHNKPFNKSFSTQFGLDYYNLRSTGTVSLDSVEVYKVIPGSTLDVSWDPEENYYLGLRTNPEDLFKQEASVLTSYLGFTFDKKYWQIASGIRLPTHTTTWKTQFEPRAKFTIYPISALILSASGGRYFQYSDRSYASEAKSGDSPGSGEFLIKTSSRTPSYADHLRFEASYSFERSYVVSVAYFAKNYSFRDRAYLARINRWFWSLPLEGGVSKGYEFWMGKTLGLWQGSLSYTLNKEVYETREGRLFRPYFNREHIFNVTMTYQINRNWEVKGQYFDSSGYPHRDWGPDRIIISPYYTAETFTTNYLSGDTQTGAIQQYAFGFSFSFSKFSKANKLEVLVTHTLENNFSKLQNDSSIWASLVFAN